MTAKEIVAWIQARLGPLNKLPSWANELLSGLLAAAIGYVVLLLLEAIVWLLIGDWDVALLSLPRLAFSPPVGRGLSELYEQVFDPSGYNPQDVVERDRGIWLVEIVAVVALLWPW